MANITQGDFICQTANFMSAIWENRVYILGGCNVVCTGGMCVDNRGDKLTTNSDLVIIDFTKSFTWDQNKLGEWIRMPYNVPQVKWATLWADKGSLYLFGGQYELYPVVEEDGNFSNTTRTPIKGEVIWQYDIASNSWRSITTSADWGKVQPVVRGQSAFDSRGGIGYVLGGAVDIGTYPLGNGTTLPESSDPVVQLSSLIRYRVDDQFWTDMTDMASGISLGSIQQGQMVHLGGLGTAGALVVIGGRLDSISPRPMNSINLYDIGTKTWYTQAATAAAGNFPASRREFCTVSASAVDGSSHNIYIYGGVDQDNNAPATSLADIWILTLPHFHWVYVGRSKVGKEAMSCNLVSERYMLAYNGRQGGNTDAFWSCDGSWVDGPLFDLTSLEWTSDYVHPARTPVYEIPEKIYSIIGGSATGNATITSPRGGFVDDKLVGIFQAALKPVAPVATPSAAVPAASPAASPKGAIIGGVIGGVVLFVAVVGCLLWLWRRNKDLTHPTAVELSTARTPKYEMPAPQPPVEMDATITIPRKPVPRDSLKER